MKEDTSLIDRAGVGLAQLKFSNTLKWIFREQPTSDYGIDAHIEIYDGSYPSGKLIALQIKTGESYTRKKDGRLIYYGDLKHYTYWMNHSLPVILVLCDLDSSTIYWQHITKDTTEFTKKGWKTEIKQNQILDSNSKDSLIKISENKSVYERFLINMSISKAWMEALDNGGTIICESEEWINKSSGLGKLRIILNEGKNNEEEILWSNNILLPFTPYEQAFEKLFPWAHITIDYDFYEQFDIEDYELDNGYYDSEEDEYITDYSYYDDYLKSMPSIRPYIIESGELAKYRLVLTLNDLGKSFLNINDHIYTKNKSNRPVKEKKLEKEFEPFGESTFITIHDADKFSTIIRYCENHNLIRVKGSTGMNMKSIFQRIYDSYLRTSEWAKYELPAPSNVVHDLRKDLESFLNLLSSENNSFFNGAIFDSNKSEFLLRKWRLVELLLDIKKYNFLLDDYYERKWNIDRRSPKEFNDIVMSVLLDEELVINDNQIETLESHEKNLVEDEKLKEQYNSCYAYFENANSELTKYMHEFFGFLIGNKFAAQYSD